MPAVRLSPIFNSQVVNSLGEPASSWKIYAYAAGSSAPLATYTDSSGTVAQSNPIVINALGFPTNGQIWLQNGLAYKLVLTDAADVVQKTEDNISGVNDTGSSVSQWQASGVDPTYVSASSFTLVGDQTSEFHVGRRLQFTTTGGTVYGTILTSAYTTLTTVTMTMDGSSTLDAGLSVVNVSILSASPSSLPFLPPMLSSADAGKMLSVNRLGTAYTTSPSISFRNKFINGAFRTNQRIHVSGAALVAGVPSTGVGYGHDGFRAGAGGLTYTFTQSKGPTQITITAGTGITVAEDLDIEGGAYILSWEGTAQARVGINGAAPSGVYAASPILIVAANAGETISAEFNVGTLGKIQLEPGDTPTVFEWPDAERQLARCQRYLPVVGPSITGTNGVLASGQCNASFSAAIPIMFIVDARVPPSGLIVKNPAGFQITTATYTGTAASTITLFGTPSSRSVGVLVNTGVNVFTAGNATMMLSSASGAALLFTGAEL